MSQIIASTYEIIEKIGSGGGGNVYLAKHLRLGKKVVLKADKRKSTTKQELLRREVDVLKELDHPYIPKVYDYFIENNITYTAMDYIQGESLDKPLARGERIAQAQVIQWSLQLLDALCYLHKPEHGDPPRGYVHSDIKPANLMRRPDGSICLIDFNIALALGEENLIGCSPGYASPEHYGLDFSSDDRTETLPVSPAEADTVPVDQENIETLLLGGAGQSLSREGPTATLGSSSRASRKKIIVPDVRSDIYSVGATLYHLLSGRRPAKNAREVVRLSEKEFSPLVVNIIAKAMNPNPDLRYQTAEEMRQDFLNLRKNDPRTIRWRRRRKIAVAVFPVCLTIGILTTFTGLKRMERTEKSLKLAEYSRNAMEDGSRDQAVSYALQAFPESENFLTPPYTAEAQKALTEAAGIYDLSDGYKIYETIELPAEVQYIAVSPSGKTAAVLYKQKFQIFDTETKQTLASLPANTSALSEAEFMDEDTILYSGDSGIKAYNIKRNEELWSGAPATALSVSGDGKTAAAVYKEDTGAVIYDTKTGKVKKKIDFGGKGQSVTVNDIFANPRDHLLTLNKDGSLLGVSFADGSLEIFYLQDSEKSLMLIEQESGYTHFEGGFYDKYFAFSASNDQDSVFAVVDTEKGEQTGGFQAETSFGVQADQNGIFVQSDNLLVRMDPVTGEQTPLVTMSDNIQHFCAGEERTMVTTKQNVLFFDKNARLTAEYKKENTGDLLAIADETALLGSMDSPVLRIMKYENHPEAELFAYDSAYEHDEARVSADEKTVMLFSYKGFRIYDRGGRCICEQQLPEAEQIYDQQFVRDDMDSYLEVIYNDGKTDFYSARDGTLLREEEKEAPDKEMYEEFLTENFRITSPLHGTPAIYDRKKNKKIADLETDAYLTYVTETDGGLVIQYVTAEGNCFGELLNEKGEILAELPYLCDVKEGTLLFDYPTGNIRESKIYQIDELIQTAREQIKEEKEK